MRRLKGSSLVVSSLTISPTRPLIRLAGQHQKPSSRQLPAQPTSSSRITCSLSTLLSAVTSVMRHTALRDALVPALNKLRIRPILTVCFGPGLDPSACSDVLCPSRGPLGYQLSQGLPACVNTDISLAMFAINSLLAPTRIIWRKSRDESLDRFAA